jgi:hypothetical protein
MQVGGEVWSGSDGGDIHIWDARKERHILELQCTAGRVRAMVRLPDGSVLTGHQSGMIQVRPCMHVCNECVYM